MLTDEDFTLVGREDGVWIEYRTANEPDGPFADKDAAMEWIAETWDYEPTAASA